MWLLPAVLIGMFVVFGLYAVGVFDRYVENNDKEEPDKET